MILVYTPILTPRIQYILEEVLSHWGLVFKTTSNWDNFLISPNHKCIYSPKQPENTDFLWIQSNELLLQDDVHEIPIQIEQYQSVPCFFKCDSTSLFPYDWFAATFYMITRYEEVLKASKTDLHGRFLPEESLAVQHQFIKIPVVDEWLILMHQILKKHISDIPTLTSAYSVNLSVDVDHIYAHHEKPWFETLGILIKNMFQGALQKNKSILNTLFLNAPDPFDYLPTWKKLISNTNLKKIYFFIYCGQKGTNDPAFYSTKKIKEVILDIKSWAKLGIHPSYQAFQNTAQTRREKQTLEHLISEPVTRSRQHFIRLQIPKTFEVLEECGITDDFTMGFPHIIGFRAGTGRSYRFFNLHKNQCSNITVHPFQITDIALFLAPNSQQAQQDAREVIRHARKANTGLFFLCHSHALCDRFDNISYFDILTSLLHEAQSAK